MQQIVAMGIPRPSAGRARCFVCALSATWLLFPAETVTAAPPPASQSTPTMPVTFARADQADTITIDDSTSDNASATSISGSAGDEIVIEPGPAPAPKAAQKGTPAPAPSAAAPSKPRRRNTNRARDTARPSSSCAVPTRRRSDAGRRQASRRAVVDRSRQIPHRVRPADQVEQPCQYERLCQRYRPRQLADLGQMGPAARSSRRRLPADWHAESRRTSSSITATTSSAIAATTSA